MRILAEFINSISSEAQEICDKDSKKTMSPEHVVEALSVSLIPLLS